MAKIAIVAKLGSRVFRRDLRGTANQVFNGYVYLREAKRLAQGLTGLIRATRALQYNNQRFPKARSGLYRESLR